MTVGLAGGCNVFAFSCAEVNSCLPMKTGAARSKQCILAMAQADGAALALIRVCRAAAEKVVVWLADSGLIIFPRWQ
jgi:hypothetical protein